MVSDKRIINKKEINDLMSNFLDLNLDNDDEVAEFMEKISVLTV